MVQQIHYVHLTWEFIASSLFGSLRSQDDPDYVRPSDEDYLRNTAKYSYTKHYKRTRTGSSPSSAKRDLEAKRLAREKLKKERREQALKDRREAKYQKFLEEVYADVPDLHTYMNGAFNDV
jgi:reverse gyrase